MTSPGHDRRVQPRVPGGDARVDYVEYVIPSARVRDISRSGMYVFEKHPYQIGEGVLVSLWLRSGEAIPVKCIVRRVEPNVGIGFEFVHMEEAGRRLLEEFLSLSSAGNTSAPA
jgi:hypothetical protein